jgi:hypothetical protein
MTDAKDDPAAAETPMQRALRLKKAALESRSGPREDRLQRKRTAGVAAGASKPWMKQR